MYQCLEEADTILVLHCINSDADVIVVDARDTDVLLLAHINQIECKSFVDDGMRSQKREHTIVWILLVSTSFLALISKVMD